MNAVVTPRPAATVTLVRDGAEGLEVLMMRRNLQSVFVPGKYVFPGGSVDRADADAGVYACCTGLDDAAASQRLGVASHGLAYWIAAIRESFEEAGLLLARAEDGRTATQQQVLALAQHRKAVEDGTLAFDALLRGAGLRMATDALVYFSHWITPVGAPRRYDTRFFVARAPDGQEAVSDFGETIESVWVRPRDGVARFKAGDFKMMKPTIHTLRLFAAHDSADALIASLRAIEHIPTIQPRIARDGRRLMPDDPGYAEAAEYEGKVEWRQT
ncbi:MAG: NUDIX hydrolase [Burkholderiales bacterium]